MPQNRRGELPTSFQTSLLRNLGDRAYLTKSMEDLFWEMGSLYTDPLKREKYKKQQLSLLDRYLGGVRDTNIYGQYNAMRGLDVDTANRLGNIQRQSNIGKFEDYKSSYDTMLDLYLDQMGEQYGILGDEFAWWKWANRYRG